MTDKSIFPEITIDAIDRMAVCGDARLRSVMTVLLEHLHAVVREVRLTEEEWAAAIGFLTRTGQICTDTRQEFILLSDVLGVSMLVDAINHDAEGVATESTVFGPFYSSQQPDQALGTSILKRPEPGEPLMLRGHVRDTAGAPIADAFVEVWQTATDGLYDVQDDFQPDGHLRGSFRTNTDGEYSFSTVLPVSYPIPHDGPVGQLLTSLGRHPFRPAHVHFMISRPGFRRLVTHLFVAGDPYLDSDAVFGVKPSLIVAPRAADTGLIVEFDFALATEQKSGDSHSGIDSLNRSRTA